jgi:hypothetical protein
MPGKPARKYVPLTAFLRDQPPEVERVTLTFAEVEDLIGEPLPRTAYTQRRSWWTNGRTAYRARIWLSVGWRVAALPWAPDGPSHWGVTFVRAPSDTIPAPRA